jgi:hypothetical protein
MSFFVRKTNIERNFNHDNHTSHHMSIKKERKKVFVLTKKHNNLLLNVRACFVYFNMASRADSRYSSELNNNSGYGNNYTQPTGGYPYNPWDFEHPWAHGLYNCTDNFDESCYSMWCFPCFTCHLAWRMNESCWITCLLPGHLAVLRTKMRTAFRIQV